MFRALVLTLLALCVIPATTLAQSPTSSTYGGQNGVLGEGSQGGGGTAPGTGSGDDTSTPPATPAPTTAPVSRSCPEGSTTQADGTCVPAATASTPTATAGSQLPFTGADVGLLAGGGLAMLALGLGLRRLTRSNAV